MAFGVLDGGAAARDGRRAGSSIGLMGEERGDRGRAGGGSMSTPMRATSLTTRGALSQHRCREWLRNRRLMCYKSPRGQGREKRRQGIKPGRNYYRGARSEPSIRNSRLWRHLALWCPFLYWRRTTSSSAER